MAARRAVVIAIVSAFASAVAGCSGSGGSGVDDVRVDRIEARGEVPTGDLLVRHDGALVGVRETPNRSDAEVVVSADGGHTWAAVHLPGRPEQLGIGGLRGTSLHSDDRVAAVSGRDLASASTVLPVAPAEFHVWTSADGDDDWDHQVLPTPGSVVGAPGVSGAGGTLVAWSSAIEAFVLYVSPDAGESWHPAPLDGFLGGVGEEMDVERVWADEGRLSMVVAGGVDPSFRQLVTSSDGGATWSAGMCDARCPPVAGVDGLLVRPVGEVSTDGGATWQEIDVHPSPPEGSDDPPSLRTVVAVPGGWLASASSDVASDVSYGQLLRSTDGTSWSQMLPPDPCDDPDGGRPNSRVGSPVRLAGRWYVTYGCSDLSTPRSAVVYAATGDADAFGPIEATRRDDVEFGAVIVDDDRLLLPERRENGALAAITVIG